MSRRGDGEGFEPHPGDPWHPSWSDEAAEPTDGHADVDSAEPRRRGFGRRRSRSEVEPAGEPPAELEPGDEATGAIRGGRRKRLGRRSEPVAEPEGWVLPEGEDSAGGAIEPAGVDEGLPPGPAPSDDDLAALIAQLDDSEFGEPPPDVAGGSDTDDGPWSSDETDGRAGERAGDLSAGRVLPELSALAGDEVAAEGDIEAWLAFIETPSEPEEQSRRRFGLGRRRRSSESGEDGGDQGTLEWGTDGADAPAGEDATPGGDIGSDIDRSAAADEEEGGVSGGFDGDELPTLDELFPDAVAAEEAAVGWAADDEPVPVVGDDEELVAPVSSAGAVEWGADDEAVPVVGDDEELVAPVSSAGAVEWGADDEAVPVVGDEELEALPSWAEAGTPDDAEVEVGSLEAADALLDDLFEPAPDSPAVADSGALEHGPGASPGGVAPAEPPPAEEEIVEGPGWSGDPGALPRSWFAEIDEDEVEPPPGDLPEVDWEDADAGDRATRVAWVEEPASGDTEEAVAQAPGAPEAAETSVPADLDADGEPTPEASPPGGTGGRSVEAPPFDPMSLVGVSAGVYEDADAAEEIEVLSAGDDEVDDWVEFVADEEVTPAQVAEATESRDDADDWTDWAGAGEDGEDVEEDLPPPPPFDPGVMQGGTPPGEAWGAGDDEPVAPVEGTDRLGPQDDEFDPMVLVERLDERPIGPPFDHEDPTLEYTPPVRDDFGERIYAGTLEHRDLAAQIARAGEDETELQALSAHMDGVHGGVVGFEDVEDLGTDEDYIPPPRSDLGARVLTGLVLISLLLGTLFVGGEALAIFIGIVVLTGLVEFYGTLRARGFRPLTLFGVVAGAGMLVATWFYGPVAIPGAILALSVVVFFFSALAPGRRDALTNGGLTVLGATWVTGTAAFAFPILDAPEFRTLVLALVVATVAMDVGAYFVGRTWGSSPLAPILSPNKSIEGLAGGVVAAVVAAVVIGRFFDPLTIRTGAWLGLVVAVLAPIGDLAESMIKRSLGVKDMGSILPGHGGILDRIDAFLFVLPAAWVLYTATGLLG